MKKILIAVMFAGFSFSAVAQHGGFLSSDNQEHTREGFKESAHSLSSVAQAKRLQDDTWVVLEGNIIKQLGHELYEFRDQSGTINVDIDDQRWMGQTLSPQDKVRIEGEVDKSMGTIEIDVKNLTVLK
ncbi:TPA: YgiW/YdeI family stress tolerance OB fold protein [Serratia fonticola]